MIRLTLGAALAAAGLAAGPVRAQDGQPAPAAPPAGSAPAAPEAVAPTPGATAQAPSGTAPATGATAPSPGGLAPAPGATPSAPAGTGTSAFGAPEAIGFADAVQRAILHATLSQLAAQEVARADALLWEVRSGSLPFLGANGTYTRIDATRTFGGRILVPQEAENAAANLSVPVLAPSRWYQWSHANDAVDVAKASQLDIQRTAALTAARAYLTVVAQKRGIDVSRRAVDNARAHYEFAHTRRAGGIGNALDEIRAEQQLAASLAQLEAVLTALVRTQEALGVATGSDRALDAASDPSLPTPEVRGADAIQAAEKDRADVRHAREASIAAEHIARDSWADWLPTLVAQAQYYWNRPATVTTPETGWQAQLLLSVPIFEGGLRVGQQRERRALSDEARTQLDGTLLQAHSEVRASFASLDHAEATFAQSKRAADRAAAALRLVTEAYRAGATNSLDVTDAERTARDADSAAVIAEDAVRQARLDLLAAVGQFP